MLLAEHGNRRLAELESRAARNGAQRTIVDRYEGKRLSRPNDLFVASSGDIYFTDPPYGLATQQVDDPDKELDFRGI